MLSQRPSLTWHSSQQWRKKKKKTEVEETRSVVQHASLYLLFLLESSHQKIPFQPLFVRMHKLFFFPRISATTLRKIRGLWIKPWFNNECDIPHPHWIHRLNDAFLIGYAFLTQRTQELILSISMTSIVDFQTRNLRNVTRNVRRTKNLISLNLYIGYLQYNFQLIYETSVLKLFTCKRIDDFILRVFLTLDFRTFIFQ